MAKHEKSFVNYEKSFEKPYETNIIGFRGIIYFGVGLFFLILITFGLMWALQNVMENQARETKDVKNPMMMSGQERLPPEPRLQAAPGFGVESEAGRVNLELHAPQSEYRELRTQWEDTWENGQKDPKTGTIVTLPLEEAKAKFLQQNANANANGGAEGEKVLDESRRFMSYSSAGRMATDKRR